MSDYTLVILFGWFLSMAFAAHLGGQRNAGMTGLFLGCLFGPFGVVAAGLLDGRPKCSRCGGRQNVKAGGERFEVCEHCGERNTLALRCSAVGVGSEKNASQERILCAGAAATIASLFVGIPLCSLLLSGFQLPTVSWIAILAGIWFGVFKLAMTWDEYAKQLPSRAVEPMKAGEIAGALDDDSEHDDPEWESSMNQAKRQLEEAGLIGDK